MPPKTKEAVKKLTPQVTRPAISNATLLYIPEDVVEGFQERIETGINWTLVEEAARHHKRRCLKENIPQVSFSKALEIKIKTSYLDGFLNEDSKLSLDQQWELILPTILWDNEKFSNNEGKTCFRSVHSITDDLGKLIKKAVKGRDRGILQRDLKMVNVLRINDSQMTVLVRGLSEYKNLVTLILCGNFIENIDCSFIPSGLRLLELQGNRISNVEPFAQYLPADLLYLGLSRNLLTSDNLKGIMHLPQHLTVLDLSENDIYNLEPLLDVLIRLQNLTSLMLAGNPCSVCAAYSKTTIMRLQLLKWLDSREILSTDRSLDPYEPHPDDLRSAYFNFTIFRVMSAPQPPKPEKGATTTFHVELEIPLLDSTRRKFLMFRRNESLTEMLPPPEDDEWPVQKIPSNFVESKTAIGDEGSSHGSDIYRRLTTKNSREICHFTIFESNKVQWNKVMNFQEPTVRIFCPDLVALRDTFRSVITVKLIYSVTSTAKQGKPDKKSGQFIKCSGEQRAVVASIKCALRTPDWSQSSQHFHWDDSLGTNDAIHWGDGDLSVLQYSQLPVKPTKGKAETDIASSRQMPPDNLTCHFGFGIETLRA